ELRTTPTEWQGRPAWVAAMRDITERRQAEEQALRLARAQAAREEAEAAARRARFLGEVSAMLAESLDYQHTVPTVAHLAVPMLGEWCRVDLVADGGGVERVAAASARVDERALPHVPPAMDDDAPVARVLRTGEPLRLADP